MQGDAAASCATSGAKLGADEFRLEADENVNLRGVGGLQTLGLDEVCFVAARHGGEGGLGTLAELYRMSQ